MTTPGTPIFIQPWEERPSSLLGNTSTLGKIPPFISNIKHTFKGTDSPPPLPSLLSPSLPQSLSPPSLPHQFNLLHVHYKLYLPIFVYSSLISLPWIFFLISIFQIWLSTVIGRKMCRHFATWHHMAGWYNRSEIYATVDITCPQFLHALHTTLTLPSYRPDE